MSVTTSPSAPESPTALSTIAVPAGPEVVLVARPQPRTFEALACQSDEEIDVLLGALLLARDHYPNVEPAAYGPRFDELAAPLVALDLANQPAHVQAKELGRHVFEVLGFKGNEAEYYDPRNSLLPDVLTRRLGIPITLALVYVEIAKRCGVNARGVSFPGHFLVRIEKDEQTLLIDPFFNGRVLDRDALVRLLRRSTGPTQELKDEHLTPASPRTILMRLLINLKWIYTTRGDNARAHLVLDRIVSLTPDAPAALRERGMLAAKLGANEAARADLKRLLEVQPDAADANVIRQRLQELEAAKRALN
jgi:regulator of sirC expression with transglutaminase-like and TPR domain